MTYEPLQDTNSEQLTLWSEDSPVKMSQLRAKGKGSSRAHGQGYGLSSPVLLARYDPESCCWKMSQLSLLSEEHRLLLTLPRWGTALNGELYQHQPWVPPTDESAGSAWPTPCRSDGDHRGMGKNTVMTSTGSIRRINSQGGQSNLGLARTVQAWATPNARDGKGSPSDKYSNQKSLPRDVKTWTTPSAADSTGSHGGGQSRSLRTDTSQMQGQLNPSWVEQLMGYPDNWTVLDGPLDPTNHNTTGKPHERSRRKPKTAPKD